MDNQGNHNSPETLLLGEMAGCCLFVPVAVCLLLLQNDESWGKPLHIIRTDTLSSCLAECSILTRQFTILQGVPGAKGERGERVSISGPADGLPACLCPGAWWGRSVLCPGHSLLCYLPPTPSSPDCEYLFKQIHPMGWRSGLLASHCSSASPARWLEAICLGMKWRGSLM